MTLIRQAQELGDRVEKLKDLSCQKDSVERYKTRKDALQNCLSMVDALRPIHNALHAVDVDVAVEEPFAKALLEKIGEIKERFGVNAESIIVESEEDSEQFWKRLSDFVRSYRKSLQGAWTNHVRRSAPTVEGEMLRVFEKLEGFSSSVSSIKNAQRLLREMEAQLPQTEEDFEIVASKAEEIRKSWQELRSDDIDANTLAFLKAAVEGKASLEMFTPDIARWLKENELLKSCKISIGKTWG